MAKALKATTIEDLLDQINEKFGSKNFKIARYGSELVQPGYITTGNLLVDVEAFGGYGFQEGTMTMITGWPGAGKSQFTKGAVRAAQLACPDKITVVLAAEPGDYTPEGMHDAGIDPARVIVIQGLPAEDALQALLDLVWDEDNKCPRNLVSLWAIDSAAALVPRAELEVEMTEEARRAALAAVLGKWAPKMNLHIGSTCGLIVNQLRKGQAAQEKPHSPGGIVLPYMTKVIMNFYPYGVEKQSGGEWSTQHDTLMKVCVEVTKNNLVRGARGARTYYPVYLMDDGVHPLGVDHGECIIRCAMILGLVQRGGSWYTVKLNGYETRTQGTEKLIAKLRDDAMLDVLEGEVRAAAQERLKKSRTPLSNLVIVDGQLRDVSEIGDEEAEEYTAPLTDVVDDVTGMSINANPNDQPTI